MTGTGRMPGSAAALLLTLLSLLVRADVRASPFPKGGYGKPTFAETIPNVTVAVGRDASLPCVVDNLGAYKVAWVHLDRQMIVTIHRDVVTKIPRFSVSHDHQRTWALHLKGAQPEDAGRYMCQVNSEPMISQVGNLHVVVPPSIVDSESSPSHLSVREGAKAVLTCRGEGVPAPRVTWRREDGRALTVGAERRKLVSVHEGDDLVFSKVSRTDSGAFLCIASNGVPPSVSKRITLDVEFPPMVWVPNQLVGAPLGSTVVLDCHTESQPRPISYWVRGDVMVLPGRRLRPDTTENGYKTHMKLTLQHLSEQDFGHYRCVAKNSLGEAEGSIRLYEISLTTTIGKIVQELKPVEERRSYNLTKVSKNWVTYAEEPEELYRPEQTVSSGKTSTSLAPSDWQHKNDYYLPPAASSADCLLFSKQKSILQGVFFYSSPRAHTIFFPWGVALCFTNSAKGSGKVMTFWTIPCK